MCGNMSVSSVDVRSFYFKRRKLSWFSHVCRNYTLPKIILEEQWMLVVAEEDLEEWTGQSLSSLLRIADGIDH